MTTINEPEPKVVQITLNGDGVIAPVHRAVRDSLEVLGIALHAIAGADLANVPPIPGSRMSFGFTGPEPPDSEERRMAYTNWLLGKAFQELARSINEALQEAYFYVEVLNQPVGQSTWGEFLEKLQEIRRRANGMNFPQLLNTVGARLNTPLQFADEYQSLQKVRNCLEHRAGVVSQKDADTNGTLKLRFPTFDFVIKTPEGKEIIVADQQIFLEAGGVFAMRFVTMEKEYTIGQRVVLTPAEFQRIAQGCLRFCADLGSKLPTRTIVIPTTPSLSAPPPATPAEGMER